MVNEVANIGTAEIHPDRNAWVGVCRISIPIGNLDHIHQLALQSLDGLAAVDLEMILREHHEVDLMEMEFVVFLRAILDRPVLD